MFDKKIDTQEGIDDLLARRWSGRFAVKPSARNHGAGHYESAKVFFANIQTERFLVA